MRNTLTALIILAGIGGAQAAQPGYDPAALGHDLASQRLALQYAQNNAMAAEARTMMRAARIGFGRPQRQMR